MSKAGFREVGAKSNEALTRFFARTGWEPTYMDLPFDELLSAEEDGEDTPPGEYELKQRMIGVRVFWKFLKGRGVTPMDLFRQLAAIGRALHEAPFNAMTMHEIAMMEGQSPAAHSWRCNILSGEIELAGMKGSRLPGQKTKDAKDSYKKCRKGNQNRKGGNKLKQQQPKQRQGSFMRLLHVHATPPKKTKQS